MTGRAAAGVDGPGGGSEDGDSASFAARYERDPTVIPVRHDRHDTLESLLDGLSERWGTPVYLVGTVDEDPDFGAQWRRGLRERYPSAPFVDPIDLWPDYWPDEETAVAGCLAAASRCDLLVGHLGATPTRGTYREIERALAAGNRVVIHRSPRVNAGSPGDAGRPDGDPDADPDTGPDPDPDGGGVGDEADEPESGDGHRAAVGDGGGVDGTATPDRRRAAGLTPFVVADPQLPIVDDLETALARLRPDIVARGRGGP